MIPMSSSLTVRPFQLPFKSSSKQEITASTSSSFFQLESDLTHVPFILLNTIGKFLLTNILVPINQSVLSRIVRDNQLIRNLVKKTVEKNPIPFDASAIKVLS